MVLVNDLRSFLFAGHSEDVPRPAKSPESALYQKENGRVPSFDMIPILHSEKKDTKTVPFWVLLLLQRGAPLPYCV